MFIEEARWIRDALQNASIRKPCTVLDIGSSTVTYRTEVQPHIHKYVHQPLLDAGCKITFADAKDEDGVDMVVDLADGKLPDSVFSNTFGLVICCNILEHVLDREIFTRNLVRFCENGGHLLLTVPRQYPKHNDPIDTMYRPGITQLFDDIKQYAGIEIVSASSLRIDDKQYYRTPEVRRLKKLTLFRLRRLLRWYIRPMRWRVTCMLLRLI